MWQGLDGAAFLPGRVMSPESVRLWHGKPANRGREFLVCVASVAYQCYICHEPIPARNRLLMSAPLGRGVRLFGPPVELCAMRQGVHDTPPRVD